MAAQQDGIRASTAPANPTLLGLSHVKRAPKWTFNGRTAPPRSMDAPGPGAYAASAPDGTSRFNKSPRYGFGLSTRDNHVKTRVPGPGSYGTTKGIGSGMSYSMTPRRTGVGPDGKHMPGPGAHDIRTTVGGGPKYSASPRHNALKKPLQPGPGEYDQGDHATIEKNPRWGFGTSQRPETASSSHGGTPGPGAYGLGSKVGDGPKFSMKARLQAPRPQPSPGPGAHGGHYSSFG